jgi:hypothetical protein
MDWGDHKDTEGVLICRATRSPLQIRKLLLMLLSVPLTTTFVYKLFRSVVFVALAELLQPPNAVIPETVIVFEV